MNHVIDPADIARVRELLRAECADCYTCTEEEADVPTDDELAAWLRGETIPGIAAWIGHMDPAWRAYPSG